MNAKRCKKIRKALNKSPIEKVKIVITLSANRIPMPFKYPLGSYQRIYRDIKNRERDPFQ